MDSGVNVGKYGTCLGRVCQNFHASSVHKFVTKTLYECLLSFARTAQKGNNGAGLIACLTSCVPSLVVM